MKVEEKNLIEAFARHLGFSVDEWPEESNPKLPRQVDAIAGPWAIEHTSVDMIEEDRTHYERFDGIRSMIERDLHDVPFPLTISLGYPDIAKVKDRRAEKRVAAAVVRR